MSTARCRVFGVLLLAGALAAPARAGVLQYGDADLLGTGTYSGSPTDGATLLGLAPGVVTYANLVQFHGFPFAPQPGDFPGTDQIYVGSNQSGSSDGYAISPERIAGPQVITLDYSSLVPAGHQVQTLTLGIAADDFQFPIFGQRFTASLNGLPAAELTDVLNGLSQTGPVVQFFTIGIDPGILLPSHVLTLSIDQLDAGSDGWAIDFLTVGVASSVVPAPPAGLLLVIGSAAAAPRIRRRRAA